MRNAASNQYERFSRFISAYIATQPTAMPRRKCNPNRKGLYVGNHTATGPSPVGKGSFMNAKCPARRIPAAAASQPQAYFRGIFTMAHMTAMTVSHPSMSNAMYQSGPLRSAGKNVEGCVQLRNVKPAKIRQSALSIPHRTRNTATSVSAKAT